MGFRSINRKHADAKTEYDRQSILMRGDNQSAIHWIDQCRGGREPRSEALMRMLRCLEVRSGWCLLAGHVKGVKNALAEGISRWDRASIPSALRNCRLDIAWQEQDLGPAGASLCAGILASSTSGKSVAGSSERTYGSGFFLPVLVKIS